MCVRISSQTPGCPAESHGSQGKMAGSNQAFGEGRGWTERRNEERGGRGGGRLRIEAKACLRTCVSVLGEGRGCYGEAKMVARQVLFLCTTRLNAGLEL